MLYIVWFWSLCGAPPNPPTPGKTPRRPLQAFGDALNLPKHTPQFRGNIALEDKTCSVSPPLPEFLGLAGREFEERER